MTRASRCGPEDGEAPLREPVVPLPAALPGGRRRARATSTSRTRGDRGPGATVRAEPRHDDPRRVLTSDPKGRGPARALEGSVSGRPGPVAATFARRSSALVRFRRPCWRPSRGATSGARRSSCGGRPCGRRRRGWRAPFGSISFAFVRCGGLGSLLTYVAVALFTTARLRALRLSFWAARFFACFVLAIVSFRVGLRSSSASGGGGASAGVGAERTGGAGGRSWPRRSVGYSLTTNWSSTIACAFSPRSRWASPFFRCADERLVALRVRLQRASRAASASRGFFWADQHSPAQ